jgi:hypothetical protein
MDIKDKKQFQEFVSGAAANGTLLTPKHGPNSLASVYKDYRTVLTQRMADNLDGFIASGDFNAALYYNNKLPNSPYYVEVAPASLEFSVPASGVQAFSLQPDYPKDRLIFYSGKFQGWHCCGESSAEIQRRLSQGELTFVKALT